MGQTRPLFVYFCPSQHIFCFSLQKILELYCSVETRTRSNRLVGTLANPLHQIQICLEAVLVVK